MRSITDYSRLGALMLLAFFLSGCASQIYSEKGTISTVILIRHADRDVGQTDLNAKGKSRAKALVSALSHLTIDAIYSPAKKRNIDTVRPLSHAHNIEISVIDTSGVASRIVEENSGKTTLWVGNTSNLDHIFARFGGTEEGPNIYGDLYILTLSDSKLEKVEKRRFGGSGSL
ncbi:MAG: histidine phosphatase family protein [Sneathiella sp.]